MSERAPVRISLTSAILIGLMGSALSIAVTWGSNAQRIETLEKTAVTSQEQNKELRAIVVANDKQLTELRVFMQDSTRRLERIERKMDEQEPNYRGKPLL